MYEQLYKSNLWNKLSGKISLQKSRIAYYQTTFTETTSSPQILVVQKNFNYGSLWVSDKLHLSKPARNYTTSSLDGKLIQLLWFRKHQYKSSATQHQGKGNLAAQQRYIMDLKLIWTKYTTSTLMKHVFWTLLNSPQMAALLKAYNSMWLKLIGQQHFFKCPFFLAQLEEKFSLLFLVALPINKIMTQAFSAFKLYCWQSPTTQKDNFEQIGGGRRKQMLCSCF